MMLYKPLRTTSPSIDSRIYLGYCSQFRLLTKVDPLFLWRTAKPHTRLPNSRSPVSTGRVYTTSNQSQQCPFLKVTWWLDCPPAESIFLLTSSRETYVYWKKCTTWELRVKFYLGQNVDHKLGYPLSALRGTGSEEVGGETIWFQWRRVYAIKHTLW